MPSPFSLRLARRNWAGAKPASAARSNHRTASGVLCGSPRPSAYRAPSSYAAAGSLAAAAVRNDGLIDAGSDSVVDWTAGAGVVFGGAGFRGIDPVTSGSLIAVEGSKNEVPLLIELVVSGSAARGSATRAFRRRHRPARHCCWSLGLWRGDSRALRLILGRRCLRRGGRIRKQELHRGLRDAHDNDSDARCDQERLQELHEFFCRGTQARRHRRRNVSAEASSKATASPKAAAATWVPGQERGTAVRPGCPWRPF